MKSYLSGPQHQYKKQDYVQTTLIKKILKAVRNYILEKTPYHGPQRILRFHILSKIILKKLQKKTELMKILYKKM